MSVDDTQWIDVYASIAPIAKSRGNETNPSEDVIDLAQAIMWILRNHMEKGQ